MHWGIFLKSLRPWKRLRIFLMLLFCLYEYLRFLAWIHGKFLLRWPLKANPRLWIHLILMLALWWIQESISKLPPSSPFSFTRAPQHSTRMNFPNRLTIFMALTIHPCLHSLENILLPEIDLSPSLIKIVWSSLRNLPLMNLKFLTWSMLIT